MMRQLARVAAAAHAASTLRVTADGGFVSVFVDGRESTVGSGSVTISDVSPGRHAIKVDV
jgi:hypothetical protein